MTFIKIFTLFVFLGAANSCARIHNLDPDLLPSKNDSAWQIKGKPKGSKGFKPTH